MPNRMMLSIGEPFAIATLPLSLHNNILRHRELELI